MFKIVRIIFGAGLMIGAPAALAGDIAPNAANGIMDACRPDYHRICANAAPGSGRAARCLLDHERELSPPCLRAIKIASSADACIPDYQRLCSSVPKGQQAFQCLAGRLDMLSPQCRRVVAANAPYMTPQGGRYNYAQGGAPGAGDAYTYREGPQYGDRYGYNQGPVPYTAPNPNTYAYRDGPPQDERYAGEGEPSRWPYGGEAYRYGPTDGDRYPDERAQRFRPYDDRYASPGQERDYDNAGPRGGYESEEEREPGR